MLYATFLIGDNAFGQWSKQRTNRFKRAYIEAVEQEESMRFWDVYNFLLYGW